MPHLPPAAPFLAQPPRGNPGAWFTSDSYPAAALRRSAEGRSVARLAIGADGRVTGCTIVTSSGDADLDRATCAVPMRAGRFVPARGADGAPVAASYMLPVRWVLPSDGGVLPVPPPGDQAEPASRHHRHWFERLLAAHHLIGLATALFAVAARQVSRWLGAPSDRTVDSWPDGDRLPVRRRRRLLPERWGRLATAIVPVVLLAALMAWLDW